MKDVVAVVLAAGKGTRIKAKNGRNKVVYSLGDKPMVAYTVDTLRDAGIEKIIAVVGYAHESVREVLGDKVTYAIQRKRLGTGHAVKSGLEAIPKSAKQVISMYGDDSAFYPANLIKKIVTAHRKSKAAVTLLTIKKDDPTGLGRIIRDDKGEVLAIVEEKNASKKQKKIKEINTGLYCFDYKFLKGNIGKIKKNEVSGEYYLTDLVEIAKEGGHKVGALTWEDTSVWFGVNTREQLKEARELIKKKRK